MRIKISNTNEAALNEAIHAANGRATAHTLNRSTLLQWVASAEQRLAELGIPKCARRGAVARRRSGGSVPSAYKYPRIRTTATIGARCFSVVFDGNCSLRDVRQTRWRIVHHVERSPDRAAHRLPACWWRDPHADGSEPGGEVNRSPAEQIADLVGGCVEDIRASRYQRLVGPSVFVVGDDYYAAGSKCPKHQVGQPWVKKETWRGDVVWVSEMEVAK